MTAEIPVPVRDRPDDPALLENCAVGDQRLIGSLIVELKLRVACYEKKLDRLRDWFGTAE